MRARERVLLAALALSIILLPAVVAHPLVRHLQHQGLAEYPRAFVNPGLLSLIGLVVLAAIPLMRAIVASKMMLQATQRGRQLVAGLTPTTGHGIAYWRLTTDEFVLMTVGLLRPTIIVSSGAETALGPGQLRAALLHEFAHCRHRDVSWRALANVVTIAFRGIPGLRSLTDTVVLRTECAADDEALRTGASRRALFDAMLIAAGGTTRPLGANLSADAVEYRLLRLAGVRPSAAPSTSSGTLALALLATTSLPFIAHAVVQIGLACGT